MFYSTTKAPKDCKTKKNNPGKAQGKVVFVVAMLGELVSAGPDVTLTLKSMIHIRPGFDSPADHEI